MPKAWFLLKNPGSFLEKNPNFLCLKKIKYQTEVTIFFSMIKEKKIVTFNILQQFLKYKVSVPSKNS